MFTVTPGSYASRAKICVALEGETLISAHNWDKMTAPSAPSLPCASAYASS